MFKRKRIYFKSRWLFLFKKEIFKIQYKNWLKHIFDIPKKNLNPNDKNFYLFI